MKVQKVIRRRKIRDGKESTESSFPFVKLFDGITSDERILKIFEGIASSSESLLPPVTGTMIASGEENKAGKSGRRL